jgi:hypothetical protein
VTTQLPVPPPVPPPPDPPANVNLNLPPELVNKLIERLAPPQHSWLYDSAATLIGAGVAILTAAVGAVIAFKVVSRQIRAGRETVAGQIAATEASVARQIASERSNRKRDERLNFVTAISDAATRFLFRALTPVQPAETQEAQHIAEIQRETDEAEVRTLVVKMQLLGMDDVSGAFWEFWQRATEYLHEGKAIESGDNTLAGLYLTTVDMAKDSLDIDASRASDSVGATQ